MGGPFTPRSVTGPTALSLGAVWVRDFAQWEGPEKTQGILTGDLGSDIGVVKAGKWVTRRLGPSNTDCHLPLCDNVRHCRDIEKQRIA